MFRILIAEDDAALSQLFSRVLVRSGEYPIASHFYAVTASRQGQPAPETENETLAGFLSWVISPQGQRIVEETGYVALS